MTTTTRKAFPNEFERRLGVVKKQIGKILQTQTEHIGAFLIKYDPLDCELLPDLSQEYRIVFQLLMDTESYENSDLRLAVEDIAETISDLLNGIDGFQVLNEVQDETIDFVESESRMTIAEYRQYCVLTMTI